MSKVKPASKTKIKKEIPVKVKVKSKKTDKAKAHRKPVKKIPYTVTIQYPGIVEVYGEVIDRSETHITVRRRIHRSRGKFEDVMFPLSSVKAAFYINEPQATLLIQDPNHEYDVFSVNNVEVQHGMYVLSDDDGSMHLCHPSITSVVQIRNAEDIPERTYKKRREEEEEEDEDEEDRVVRKKKPVAPPVEDDDEGEYEEEDEDDEDEEDEAPPAPVKPAKQSKPAPRPAPPPVEDDEEDDEDEDDEDEEDEPEDEVETHDEDEEEDEYPE